MELDQVVIFDQEFEKNILKVKKRQKIDFFEECTKMIRPHMKKKLLPLNELAKHSPMVERQKKPQEWEAYEQKWYTGHCNYLII